MGLALSADALRLLSLLPEDLGDQAFSAGLAARAGLLGDPRIGPGSPDTWVVGGTPNTTPHALVILGAETESQLDRRVAELKADPDGEPGFEERGQVLDGDREHFGFTDGLSHVGIRGRLSGAPRHYLTRRWIDPDDPLARLLARPGQPLVWPGQFLFGLSMQSLDDPLVPAPPRAAPGWARNGSLLAFRRLRQDVPAFRRFTAAESARLQSLAGFEHVDQALLEAVLVGRWPDGTALSRTEGFAARPAPKDMLATNYFGFAGESPGVQVCADPKVAAEERSRSAGRRAPRGARRTGDPAGRRCPAFAHIRKVNPRDLVTTGVAARPPRFCRCSAAGSPGGRRTPTASRSGREPRPAVHELADLAGAPVRAAEHPVDEPLPRPEGNAGHDLLVGKPICALRFPWPERPAGRSAPWRWMMPTGGGYFFGPSLSTLRALGRT